MGHAADTSRLRAFGVYVDAVQSTLAGSYASEGSHYPALKTLLESLAAGVRVTVLPSHIRDVAPDFIITEGSLIKGHVEAKDIGKNLDDIEQGKGADGARFSRYLGPLTNLVLTDYLDFRWYVDGECRLKARLGTLTKDGKVRRDIAGVERVDELLGGFLSQTAQTVGTPKELAKRMARQAHLIRNLIINAFEREPEGASLHRQLTAFRANLIPDLSVEQFADMYAQTIAYGLFAARCTSNGAASFTRQNAAYMLPKTNPFLRKLFNHIAGPDLDERIAWLVDDLAQLLAQADMEAVLKDFGKRTAREDPVVHFYETFLKEYDPKVREMRGVYYTPEPVVSYIVRSVDRLLEERFNKPQGLADPGVYVLDPAVGTATFLYMVINEIHEAVVARGQKGLWNDYVAEKLLPRIFGFELLMAPYAVAHLKLGLLLQESGYEFQTDQRLGIYLTNTLEEAARRAQTLFDRWITEEANAAAEIKTEKPIMVVLGNPPYSGHSANNGQWARQLVERYKTVDGRPLGEKNPKWLQDDYVKFIAFGQWRIESTGQGILGFITNHAYLDNPTFRGMRQSLMSTFTDAYILNLHGNVKRKELAPEGGKDENVFDIQQGVAIGILVKEPGTEPPCRVHYADLWGLREGKYGALIARDIGRTDWTELQPSSPSYLFVPLQQELLEEYESGWKITDVFPVSSVGIVTSRDDFVLDFDEAALRQRIADFMATALSDDEVRDRFEVADKEGWTISGARQSLRQDRSYERAFTRCLYRPFDIRPIFYHDAVIERGRAAVMRHMLAGENFALICMRQVAQSEPYSHFGVARVMVDNRAFYSNRGIQCLCPLYLYRTEGEMRLEGDTRRPNLNPAFVKAVSDRLALTFVEDGRGDLNHTVGPEDIFNYVYAVFHSPAYRTRYDALLRIDFPRLPLTSDRGLVTALVEKGAELVSLHLMESPVLNRFITRYPAPGSNTVEKVTYDENSERVHINKTQYFEGVPPEVWKFHIGGYQVCQKWLKDRKGRTLTYDELTHYQKVTVVLKETIRVMSDIDEVIGDHGGWPLGST